jgi:hypothetical protein
VGEPVRVDLGVEEPRDQIFTPVHPPSLNLSLEIVEHLDEFRTDIGGIGLRLTRDDVRPADECGPVINRQPHKPGHHIRRHRGRHHVVEVSAGLVGQGVEVLVSDVTDAAL